MNFHLVSGPPPGSCDRAQCEALVRRMAADLVATDSFASERDAIRILMAKRYRALDVAVHADNARQVAMQTVVAREMSQP